MKKSLGIEIYEEAIELQRLGNRAVKRAQEENRKKGVPNVYSYNGELYYELPTGELTKEDPIAQKGLVRCTSLNKR